MKTFIIDRKNSVVTAESGANGLTNRHAGVERFSTLEGFAEVTREWPLARLVAVWNGMRGQTHVRKFTDRKTAVTRIWKALENAGSRPHRSEPSRAHKNGIMRTGTKKARVLNLLQRRQGATLQDITRATGWQTHSVRGFISGNLVRQMKLKITTGTRASGERSYRILRG
jgi:Protein of unknown function (DUF3489)